MSEERSIREVRLEKLQKMRDLGCDPFAQEKFEVTHSATELLDKFEELGGEQELETPNSKLQTRFAGRVVSYRLMGKAGFAHLSDGDGKIQCYFRKDDLTATEWELYQLLDIGDHVGVTGELFRTKTGEKSIHVRSMVVLSKSLQPLPIGKVREIKDGQGNVVGTERWYELEDVDQRYRHRHLDLITNPEARQMLINRAKITTAVRRYFDSQGYLEVETPTLQHEAGGAMARTFATYYNAYEMDVKLRISLELYLKRLICGDLPKVYEIGRVYRNEGVSNRHSPEFTMCEFYEAYANLEDMMTRMEELCRFVAVSVFGTADLGKLDFSKPWKRVDLLTAIKDESGLDLSDLSDLSSAAAKAKELNIPEKAKERGAFINLDKENNLGGLIEKLLEVFVEPGLQEPTFVIGYPIETSPLAKKDPNRPGFTRRFEGYILGRELCNAFSEINDPIDQRERFMQQAAEKAKGDDEAHPVDEEFLYALEAGMPPTGGCGFGIDRLAMLLTGADHIREVLFFPTMRPQV